MLGHTRYGRRSGIPGCRSLLGSGLVPGLVRTAQVPTRVASPGVPAPQRPARRALRPSGENAGHRRWGKSVGPRGRASALTEAAPAGQAHARTQPEPHGPTPGRCLSAAGAPPPSGPLRPPPAAAARTGRGLLCGVGGPILISGRGPAPAGGLEAGAGGWAEPPGAYAVLATPPAGAPPPRAPACSPRDVGLRAAKAGGREPSRLEGGLCRGLAAQPFGVPTPGPSPAESGWSPACDPPVTLSRWLAPSSSGPAACVRSGDPR